MTYAEFLKSQGALEEEIKVMVTPLTEKAFMAMQAQGESLAAERVKAYEAKVNDWYSTQIAPISAKQQRELDTAKSDLAAERARVKALQDAGLLEVAANQDARTAANNGGQPVTAAATSEPLDIKKLGLITTTDVAAFGQAQGKGMVRLLKIAREHEKLGLPDCDFDGLYDEAVAAGKQFPEYWAQKYNVQAKRDELAAKSKTEYEERLRKEGRESYIKENGGGMPGTSAPRPSGFAFTKKTSDGKSDNAPWLHTESERMNATIEKALGKMQQN